MRCYELQEEDRQHETHHTAQRDADENRGRAPVHQEETTRHANHDRDDPKNRPFAGAQRQVGTLEQELCVRCGPSVAHHFVTQADQTCADRANRRPLVLLNGPGGDVTLDRLDPTLSARHVGGCSQSDDQPYQCQEDRDRCHKDQPRHAKRPHRGHLRLELHTRSQGIGRR